MKTAESPTKEPTLADPSTATPGGASDLMTPEKDGPKETPRQILKHEIQEGLQALERSSLALFLSALSGGLDVGFSLLLMAAMWTGMDNQMPPIVAQLMIAAMYSVGFVFVVIGRSELFTEQTTLAVLPVLRGRASVGQLLRLWGIVYVANLIGACGFAALAAWIGPALGVIEPRAFGVIAHRMIDHDVLTMFVSAVLAGWLMGLLSWLVAAGRDTISQIVIVGIITTVIGFAGLHHVVMGSVEVLAGVFADEGIGISDYLRFLLWATLGNILGGSFFVALIKYGHARPEPHSV